MIPFRTRSTSQLVLLTLLALGAPGMSFSESSPPDSSLDAAGTADSPLAPFELLVGGEWQISILRHRFEWGIGRHTVLARSYDGDGKLAAEARWFWHPGEKVIKGYSIDATGNSFAEMTTRFEEGVMINVLQTIDPEGTTATYTGRWLFTDRDHYDWTLFSHGANGEKTQVMQATASREAQSE